MNHEDDTEPIHILILWLELQQAMESARPIGSGDAQAVPWNSTNERVRTVWNELTHPRNERAMRQWLSVVTSTQDEAWTHQAIQECLTRKANQ